MFIHEYFRLVLCWSSFGVSFIGGFTVVHEDYNLGPSKLKTIGRYMTTEVVLAVS